MMQAMKFLCVILWGVWYTTILTISTSALIISEVEPNPDGVDKGFEWVELYHDGEISLEGYSLVNSAGKNYSLSGMMTNYGVVVFSKQWLNNKDLVVTLMQGETIVSQTVVLRDDADDGRAWSLCGGEWLFRSASKGGANTCEATASTTTMTNTPPTEEETEENPTATVESFPAAAPPLLDTLADTSDLIATLPGRETIEPSSVPLQTKIVLSSKSRDVSAMGETTKDYRVRMYVIYAFLVFATLLIILLALRKL
jgi:hypothetical protein